MQSVAYYAHVWPLISFPFPCDRLNAETQSGHLGRICRLNRVWPVELDRTNHALDRSTGRDGRRIALDRTIDSAFGQQKGKSTKVWLENLEFTWKV